MDIEQRVKSLEQEMKILKNQVQKTLLDIQEQILVHYHPALRTEDDSFEENNATSKETGRSGGSNGLRPEASFSDQATGGLKVRQVSLADLRQSNQPPAEPTLTAPIPAVLAAAPAAKAMSDDEIFAGLVEWVSESVAKIGAKRTQKLLDLRAATGTVTREVYDTLQQLITLCDENEGADAAETAVLLQQLSQLLKPKSA
jgi:hypothetical protein